jgi:two-component system, OmpR family, phosphate regulon sensor histidine kinase PhoR
MAWLLPRFLAGVLATVIGGLIGFMIGSTIQAPVTSVLVGGACASCEPRDTGFWGELGYRVERTIRLREQGIEQERARLAHFLSAIEASPNGVLMLDAGDQIEWCNSVAADHFGLDPQRDRRQRVTNLVRAPAFVALLQGGQSAAPAVFPDPRGGRTLSVLIRRYDEDMKLVLSQDITERVRSDAMRRDFVANVSHEIRTPLTVVAGFIETMANLPLTEAERKRVLVLMGQQTQRMQSLVSDLLTLAQLEGSPRPSVDRWVDLKAVFAQVQADALALSAGRHQVVFSPVGSVQLAGEAVELASAVGNLVNNAVRYTPERGRIDVHWRVLVDGSGEVAVTDTGPGIAREHLPRLTERFYRVDGSRSRDTGGTGLGLSIVKHVMQRHGGELDIQSEPGKGSTFRLVFPAARVQGEPRR